MHRIRGKLTYANVISTLCLMLVVGGGSAYATSKLLPRNSVGPRQLKKGAVTPAKLSAKAKVTLTGAVGATGPAGPKGEPGPATTVLASGHTETGAWAVSGGMPNFLVEAIDFYPTLPGPVPVADESFLVEGASSTACPAPGRAAPGHLCVYETLGSSTEFLSFQSPTDPSSHSADPAGVILYLRPEATSAATRGTWSYSAP